MISVAGAVIDNIDIETLETACFCGLDDGKFAIFNSETKFAGASRFLC